MPCKRRLGAIENILHGRVLRLSLTSSLTQYIVRLVAPPEAMRKSGSLKAYEDGLHHGASLPGRSSLDDSCVGKFRLLACHSVPKSFVPGIRSSALHWLV